MDLFALAESYSFVTKMKTEITEQLGELESWVKTQSNGLNLASNPAILEKKFDSLLVVMDALFKVSIRPILQKTKRNSR